MGESGAPEGQELDSGYEPGESLHHDIGMGNDREPLASGSNFDKLIL